MEPGNLHAHLKTGQLSTTGQTIHLEEATPEAGPGAAHNLLKTRALDRALHPGQGKGGEVKKGDELLDASGQKVRYNTQVESAWTEGSEEDVRPPWAT